MSTAAGDPPGSVSDEGATSEVGAVPGEVHLRRLEHALTSRRASTPLEVWRWAVLQRMVTVRELLVQESDQPADWTSARDSRSLRERNRLLGRMSELRFRMMGDPDVDRAGYEMRRLVAEIREHLVRGKACGPEDRGEAARPE
ncbi:hypothetical protein [Nocardioides campestrisoli]|uniref:hypothetical protein n=1 Tax=Nocardioides campestrisoli TaxID=2736757 RepID=UPI0015E6A2C7|nr:hypothetical protein [Nocardioides campestrisoli]